MEWNCSACTFANSAQRNACELCETARTVAKGERATPWEQAAHGGEPEFLFSDADGAQLLFPDFVRLLQSFGSPEADALEAEKEINAIPAAIPPSKFPTLNPGTPRLLCFLINRCWFIFSLYRTLLPQSTALAVPKLGKRKRDADEHGRDKKKTHVCTACGNGFGAPNKLALHIRCHTNEKPYTCKVCLKGFSWLSHMTTHLRTHTGEKPRLRCVLQGLLGVEPSNQAPACDVCSKGFSE